MSQDMGRGAGLLLGDCVSLTSPLPSLESPVLVCKMRSVGDCQDASEQTKILQLHSS